MSILHSHKTVAGVSLVLSLGLIFASIAEVSFAERTELQVRLTESGGSESLGTAPPAARAMSATGAKKALHMEGEIIVKYKNDKKPFHVVRLPQGKRVEDAVAEYAKRSDVEYVEPNYIAEAFMVPNDQYYSYQWHLDNAISGGIGMEAAWDISTGAGVTVAVVDTGIAYENNGFQYPQAPDLANTCFVSGYDFVNGDTHPNDDEGHGTHVAGTIAQSTNNSTGVAGIAFGACLMPVKVLNQNGSGTYAQVADGIRFAADNGAHIINLSLGGSASSQTLEDAVKYAYEKGVLVVAASGNDGAGTIGYPAAYDAYVLAVGATRYDETRASYSNYGTGLDLVAPGGDTNVDQNGDGYGDGVLQQTFEKKGWKTTWGYYFYQGTSMASPHIAGAAALVRSHGNATTPDELREALQSTARDLGSAGWDNTYGWGLIDVPAALAWIAGTPPPPPPPEPTETEVFYDSFETSSGNNWGGKWTEDSQDDWSVSSQRATAGSFSAEVDGSASNASLTSVSVDLQEKSSATISFSWLIENSLDSGEYLAFEVSTNGGASFTEYARLRGNVDAEDVWHNKSFEISGASAVIFRFKGTMSMSNEDANVDAVKVVAR